MKFAMDIIMQNSIWFALFSPCLAKMLDSSQERHENAQKGKQNLIYIGKIISF
jgi:hypothetical protein